MDDDMSGNGLSGNEPSGNEYLYRIDYNTGFSYPYLAADTPVSGEEPDPNLSGIGTTIDEVDHQLYGFSATNSLNNYAVGSPQVDEVYNRGNDYVPSYEKEYQNPFLHEMMTDPKAETLKQEIEARGGSCGFFNVSLVWDNTDDLDLSVDCPSGEKIYYAKKTSKCGGKLDIDANFNGMKTTQVPIENIYWDELPQNGKYRITVSNYQTRTGGKTPFRCLVRYKEVIKAFDGEVGHKENQVVFDDLIEF